MLTLIPHYKRPEVLEITAKILPEWVEPFYILSPQDCYFNENKKILSKYSFDYCTAPNFPLNMKLNYGIKEIRKRKFEYMMFLNSDSLINKDYLNLLDIVFRGLWPPVVGTSKLYFTDISFNNTYCYDYPIDFPLGSGRIISRRVIDKCEILFPGNQNSGMDGLLAETVKKENFKIRLLKEIDIPLILDIKTATNLTPMKILSSKAKRVDWKEIKKYFGG